MKGVEDDCETVFSALLSTGVDIVVLVMLNIEEELLMLSLSPLYSK